MSTETKKHSELGASIAKRWVNCPGSVGLCRKVAPMPESSYAREGTFAHECHETMLKPISPSFKAGGSAKKEIALLKEKYAACWDDVETSTCHIRKLYSPLEGDTLIVEKKLNLEFIYPGMFGTLDAAIVRHFDHLRIFDYKHGQNQPVDVFTKKEGPNLQLVYYALGASHMYDDGFNNVTLTVCQPRAQHKAGPIRSHTMTMDALQKYVPYFRRAAEATAKKNAPFKKGSWCFFCPARYARACKTYLNDSQENAKDVFADELSGADTAAKSRQAFGLSFTKPRKTKRG